MDVEEARAIGTLLAQLDYAKGAYASGLGKPEDRVKDWADEVGINIRDREIEVIKAYRQLAYRRRCEENLARLESMRLYDVAGLIRNTQASVLSSLPSLRTLARELVVSRPELLSDYYNEKRRDPPPSPAY